MYLTELHGRLRTLTAFPLPSGYRAAGALLVNHGVAILTCLWAMGLPCMHRGWQSKGKIGYVGSNVCMGIYLSSFLTRKHRRVCSCFSGTNPKGTPAAGGTFGKRQKCPKTLWARTNFQRPDDRHKIKKQRVVTRFLIAPQCESSNIPPLCRRAFCCLSPGGSSQRARRENEETSKGTPVPLESPLGDESSTKRPPALCTSIRGEEHPLAAAGRFIRPRHSLVYSWHSAIPA